MHSHLTNRFLLSFALLVLFASVGFFVWTKVVLAQTADHLVISEVQISGTTADDEFIEIYNPTSSAVNIETWSIQYKSATGTTFYKKNFSIGASVPAHGWYLIGRTDDYTRATMPDMTHRSFSLANAGGHIFLVTNQILLSSTTDPSIIDKVGYGTANSPEGIASYPPPSGQSIERRTGGEQGNGEDTNSNSADFFLQINPNPQNSKSPTVPSLAIPVPGSPDSTTTSAPTFTPAPTQESAPIASPSTPTENQGQPSSYESSAPLPSTTLPSSMEGTPSQPLPLSVPSPQSSPFPDNTLKGVTPPDTLSGVTPTSLPLVSLGDVVINEFVSDPTDGEEEWVELYNNTQSDIDLNDWYLIEGSETKTKLSGIIGPKDNQRFLVIEKIKGNLNNKGDIIFLKDKDNKIIDQVTYGNWNDGNLENNAPLASDPYSLARLIDGQNTFNNAYDFKVTAKPTKRSSNIILEPAIKEGKTLAQNKAKVDGLILSNDSAFKEENYKNQIIINEILPNPLGADEEEFIELKNNSDNDIDLMNFEISDKSGQKYQITAKDFSSTMIKAGNFFVLWRKQTNLALNNTGEESLSLYSPQGNLVDYISYQGKAEENQAYVLIGSKWQWTSTPTLGTSNILSLPNRPPVAVINAPVEALVDEVVIFDASDSYDPDKDKLNYQWTFGSETKEGITVSYIFTRAGARLVTLVVSDGQVKRRVKHKISIKREEGETDSIENEGMGVEGEKVEKQSDKSENLITLKRSRKSNKLVPPSLTVPLKQIREQEIGTMVKTKGVVAVEPGILGSQIFYLAGSGIQVYNYKKEFPILKIGDLVELKGALSEVGGEKRIKVAEKNDIKFLNHQAPPLPQAMLNNEIEESDEGALVTVEGQVTETKGPVIYLDNGSAQELKIYLKESAKIKKPKIKDGDTLIVTGIVSQTRSGFRILPRYQNDLKVAKVLEAEEKSEQGVGRDNNESLNKSKQTGTVKQYLFLTAGALVLIIIGLLVKYGAKIKTILRK